jgi:hypothetical protein
MTPLGPATGRHDSRLKSCLNPRTTGLAASNASALNCAQPNSGPPPAVEATFHERTGLMRRVRFRPGSKRSACKWTRPSSFPSVPKACPRLNQYCWCFGPLVTPREELHVFIDGIDDNIARSALHTAVETIHAELIPAVLERMRFLRDRIADPSIES